ncbi:unnamed protein product [Ranitomeya imitator]|uniref:Helix-turn-helix domain-containing protein n=1 Tax=Ranitomeya imitator TaxID=111125 RepID=A0ABN9KRS3_9NEOB|nr:unnamed protein product [Ranitomeya imitator]
MSAETYVYDETTGSTILSKIKTNTDFLHLPSKDVKLRDWEKERKKLISYDLHCATLGEYHRQARIPRGLRCNLRPTLFSDNVKYCATFQKILNKCSFDIILLTIEYLQKAIKNTEEKIESIETQLTATLNTTELSTLKSKIDSSLVTYQRSLEERKRTKFQRDTEDYLSNKVYRWEESAPRRTRSRYRRTPGGNYPSGGSSPAGGSSAGSGSETELKVLNMGLSFCPTPKWDSFQLERDLQRFYRNIRLKVHFEEPPSSTVNRLGITPSQREEAKITLGSLGLRNPSTFVPPKSNHAVETFINLLDRDIKGTIHEQRLGLLPVRHNLNPLEKQALDTLSENRNIVIKPADKGGAIVIMNKHQYVTERHLFHGALHTCGTAMGSNVAPAYANLYMDHFERKHVYANPHFQQHALIWYRYIDDIFCIWKGNHTSLQEFYNDINTTRPELTFTLSYHHSEVTFLDTKVLKDSVGNLSTDIYSKPTDCNSLLLYNSCHPKSTKDSLPRSQFKRVSRIVSDPEVKTTSIQFGLLPFNMFFDFVSKATGWPKRQFAKYLFSRIQI